ncbi:hypothetical protein OS242_19005 [Tumebacillus sp. DT12]|uniref:Uncharacterized protein n=1 Tax=Tumebacillus lacus TaxID=2995335 RepID=A0ABT3XB97_9BACL|nr:hypothetical protein [Tumebacillus lacus]MCX7572029.1 hypothetical protein [Tumebacillus lacus]
MMIKDREVVLNEIDTVLESGNLRPYVFRTRLERVLVRITALLEDNNKKAEVVSKCNDIRRKLNYISDKSNQTPDGTLNSYIFLKGEIESLKQMVK